MIKFQNVFKELLDEKEISAKKLGKIVGIDHTSIYCYLQDSLPNLENAIKLATYFDCSLQFLFGLEEYRTHEEYKECDVSKFYPRYESLLKKNNISHYALSREIGINNSSLLFWKRGKTPKMDSLIKIAEYFDVSIDYLVGRSDRY